MEVRTGSAKNIILGATGQVGAAVPDALLKKGESVIILLIQYEEYIDHQVFSAYDPFAGADTV